MTTHHILMGRLAPMRHVHHTVRVVCAAIALAVASAAAAQPAPDRSKPPATGPAPALSVPAIQQHALSNGLPVWVVEMHEVPARATRSNWPTPSTRSALR